MRSLKKVEEKCIEELETLENESLAKLVSENPNPVLRVAKNGKVLYSNKAGKPMLTIWKAKVGGMVTAAWKRKFADVLSGKRCKTEDVRSGSNIYSIEMVPIAAAGYVNIYARDITAHYKAEHKLKESEMKYRSVVDNIGIGVALISPDYKILALNKQIKKWFPHINAQGQSPCRALFDRGHKSDSKKICDYCPTVMTFKDGKVHEVTIDMLEGDNTLHYRMISSPIKDRGGKVIAAVEMIEDITERNKMQEMLVESEKLASIGLIVAEMSHEINNPIQIITGRAQLALMSEYKKESMERCLNIILDQGMRAKGIMTRLLNFSKPSKEGFKEANINKAITSIVELVVHQYYLKNVKLTAKLSPSLPKVKMNERNIQEVILNLMNNAVDALPDGGDITITSSKVKGNIKIEVADDGQGMTDETKKRLFEPFYTTKDKGTGLGLSVCFGIIKSHNGVLKFKSKLEKGTTAIITLPVKSSKKGS